MKRNSVHILALLLLSLSLISACSPAGTSSPQEEVSEPAADAEADSPSALESTAFLMPEPLYRRDFFSDPARNDGWYLVSRQGDGTARITFFDAATRTSREYAADGGESSLYDVFDGMLYVITPTDDDSKTVVERKPLGGTPDEAAVITVEGSVSLAWDNGAVYALNRVSLRDEEKPETASETDECFRNSVLILDFDGLAAKEIHVLEEIDMADLDGRMGSGFVFSIGIDRYRMWLFDPATRAITQLPAGNYTLSHIYTADCIYLFDENRLMEYNLSAGGERVILEAEKNRSVSITGIWDNRLFFHYFDGRGGPMVLDLETLETGEAPAGTILGEWNDRYLVEVDGRCVMTDKDDYLASRAEYLPFS